MSVSKQLEEILRQEEHGQKEYRNLYQKNPAAYDSPIRSWKEFRERFSTEIAKEAPTPIKGFLSEKEIFPNEDVQVHCFKNVRFCPPFLHKLEFIKIVYIMEGTAVFISAISGMTCRREIFALWHRELSRHFLQQIQTELL